jgi:nitrite reductase (NADH) large subunit
MPKYLIVGSGVAGVTAAQNLARSDPAAQVVLLGEEPYPYYYRPKLWEFLARELEQPALFYRPMEWYASQNITLRLQTKAAAIRPSEHQAVLTTGERLPYDRLLLSTGSLGFVPAIPGATLPGVSVLRTLEDAQILQARASQSRRAIIIGGGLLGLETARALSALRLEVTVVEMAPYLLPRQLDREGALFLQARLQTLGLAVIAGARPAAILGADAATGVQLEDGRFLPGELILFSAGIVPRVELAREAGLNTRQGIVVDQFLQTSMDDVYAAGDAAEFDQRVYGLVNPAVEQARIAAQNMAGGQKTVYRGTLTSTTLKIVGMELTSLGEATAEGGPMVVVRGLDEAAGRYRRFVLRDGVLVGAILLNDAPSVVPVRQLMDSRKNISGFQDRLSDPTFDLKALAQGGLP